ncbi:hypothetical protein [Sphingomonas sp. H160509]|uniref:hypothetical protein n=1 Tax=Sphingomonas sp. H160509 TaxID=2955313 RepID=UPI0031581D07
MTSRAAPAPAASQATINVLTALLEARTGQQIAAYRSWRLDTALKPLLRARKLDTLDQLVTQLLQGSDRSIGDSIVDAPRQPGDVVLPRRAGIRDARRGGRGRRA